MANIKPRLTKPAMATVKKAALFTAHAGSVVQNKKLKQGVS